MPGEHALLSPSSSSRWLYCTRAPRLEEKFPETTSDYAEEGTLAHAIAELKARKYFAEPMSTRAYNARMKKLKAAPHYDPGMENATEQYLDYLKRIAVEYGETPPFVALETRVDFSSYAPGGFGKADCIMARPPVLYVVDYKNGAGVPVDAEHNPQMMLYALGALNAYAPIYGDSIQEVLLAIVQPHAGGVKEWSIPRADLERWGEETVKPAAALAYAGKGEFAPSEGRCRFCRAGATCTARAEMYLGLEEHKNAVPEGKAPPGAEPTELLTDAEIGPILTRAEGLVAWAADLKEYALGAVLAGRAIPGYKAVAGRSTRAWSDMDAAFATMQKRGVAEALLWERKPVTPPALEKALGKKAFADSAADLVEKRPGKPTLAPESDKRPPYYSAETAFKAVGQ